jgi:hypothetical protein
MKKIIVLFVTVFFLTANLIAQLINDPNAELREAKSYHGIIVSGAFNVYLTQGTEEAVAVSAASIKDREMISVAVKDGILYVGIDKNWKWNSGNKKLKAYISFKQIDRLIISGACDVFVTGTIKADQFSIKQSGASDFKGKLDISKLAVDLSGASDLTVSGNAKQLYVEASGASTFKGYELNTDICDIHASGASDIRITVNKELSAEASGASDIKYKGPGIISKIKSSGASSVSKG